MGEIVTGSDPGRHNSDLDRTCTRILEGGSWKKQRVVLLIPSAYMLPAKVALSWWNLIFPPNQPVFRFLILGYEVGDAYSTAIDQVLADPNLRDWEFILTIEHDNVPPQDGVLKLIRRLETHPELSAVGGLYFTKGEGGQPQIWGDPFDPLPNMRPQAPRPGELVECQGTGMGFTLFRLSVFKDKRLRRPWFKTVSSMSEGVGTQDLYFWGDARKYGYRCAVDCDVLVGHHDASTGITW